MSPEDWFYGKHDQVIPDREGMVCLEPNEWYYAAFEARPVVRGELVEAKDAKEVTLTHRCKECGCYMHWQDNFCPQCGADMRGMKDGRD